TLRSCGSTRSTFSCSVFVSPWKPGKAPISATPATRRSPGKAKSSCGRRTPPDREHGDVVRWIGYAALPSSLTRLAPTATGGYSALINGDSLVMRDPNTHGGIRFTDRRHFLWQFGGGLGGIALASLLNQEGLLATPHF